MIFDYVLSGVSENGKETFEVAEGQVSGANEEEARNKAMENWDDRLDISGCRPELFLEEYEFDDPESFAHLEIGKEYFWRDPRGLKSQKVIVDSVDSESANCRTKNGIKMCYPDELEVI